MEDELALGGNIILAGFRELDRDSLVVVKKMVGSYVRKMSDRCKDLQEVHVHLRALHETGNSKKHELRARAVDAGFTHASEFVDRNLFVALDKVMSKLVSSMG